MKGAGRTITVDGNDYTPIGNIHKHIWETLDIPIDEQILNHGIHTLVAERYISDYGIAADSNIFLSEHTRGGAQQNHNPPNLGDTQDNKGPKLAIREHLAGPW